MVATSSAAVGASPKKKAKSAAKTGVGSSAGRASSAYMLGDRAGEYESDEERVDFEVRSFDEGAVDGLLLMVLKQLRPHAAHFAYLADKNDDDVDSADGNARAGRRSFKELCALEIKRQECLKSELSAMMAAWDRYSDLLKAHDELAQSKTRMSLLLPSIGGAANTSAAAAAGGLSAAGGTGGATDGATGGSSASARKGGSKTKASTSFREPAEEESALHLRPYELPASIAKSYSAVLQADGELKRSLGSLQFYKEQVREIFAETHEEEEGEEEEVSAVAAQHDSTTAAATNSGTATSSAASVNMAGETSAGAGAAKAVFSTPSKARVQACLFCRDELQLGNPLHSPTRHRSSLPTEEGGAEERPTLTEEVVVLPCAHRYHRNCVTKWVQKHKACPLCKAKAAVSDFIAVAQYAVGPSGARLPETPVTPAKVSSALSSTIAGTPGGVVQAQSPVKSVRFIEHSAGALSTGKVPPVGDDISATTGGSRFATTANSDKSDTSSGGSSIQPIQQGHSSSPLQAQPQQQQRHVLKSRLKGKWGTKVDTLVMDLLELTLDANRQDEKAIVFSQWIEVFFFCTECFSPYIV